MLLLALSARSILCMAFVDDGPRQMGSDKRSSQSNRMRKRVKRRESLDLNEWTPMGWMWKDRKQEGKGGKG